MEAAIIKAIVKLAFAALGVIAGGNILTNSTKNKDVKVIYEILSIIMGLILVHWCIEEIINATTRWI